MDIDGRVADAEGIPYEDNTFDLVGSGTPCCTTSPMWEKSLREWCASSSRAAGSSSPVSHQRGNVYARNLSTLTWHLSTNITKLPGLERWRRPQEELDESSRAAALEAVVDLHTFDPEDLERMATNAGAVEVATASEEFTGVHARLADPHLRGFGAAGDWVGAGRIRLQQLDHAGAGWSQRLASGVPKGWFYNVMVTGSSRRSVDRRRRRLPVR